jgi:hypothetical protein
MLISRAQNSRGIIFPRIEAKDSRACSCSYLSAEGRNISGPVHSALAIASAVKLRHDRVARRFVHTDEAWVDRILWNLGIRAWPQMMAQGLPRPIGMAPRCACACEGCFAWNGDLGCVAKPLFAFEHRCGVAPVLLTSWSLSRRQPRLWRLRQHEPETAFQPHMLTRSAVLRLRARGEVREGAVAVDAARTGPDMPIPM